MNSRLEDLLPAVSKLSVTSSSKGSAESRLGLWPGSVKLPLPESEKFIPPLLGPEFFDTRNYRPPNFDRSADLPLHSPNHADGGVDGEGARDSLPGGRGSAAADSLSFPPLGLAPERQEQAAHQGWIDGRRTELLLLEMLGDSATGTTSIDVWRQTFFAAHQTRISN